MGEAKNRENKAVPSTAPNGKKLYTHALDKPLSLKGTFFCEVKGSQGVAQPEFSVIPLLD